MTVTISELTEIYRKFWPAQIAAAEARMKDETLRSMALSVIKAEQKKKVPVPFQTSIEKALEDAEQDVRLILRQQARRGGLAEKADALQVRILELVKANPELKSEGLLQKLHAEQCPGGLIEEVDFKTIIFQNRGRLKEVRVSGLKHRLTRARKKQRENKS